VWNFRELIVWERSHALTLEVYRVSSGFPREERFGLTQQVRGSSSSIPSNIAEGCGRETDREFVRFLTIASGSASETEYRLLLAKDLGYLPASEHEVLQQTVTEIRRMLAALIRRFRRPDQDL
jgi:four helix bundle protein